MLAVLAATAAFAIADGAEAQWSADFAAQPLSRRPRLEARYVDATRQALRIEGEDYEVTLHLDGDRDGAEIRMPLDDPKTHDRLWVSDFLSPVAEGAGVGPSFGLAESKSRVNIYRRGPYYVEVHWLDVMMEGDTGEFPARGEIVLYCYPDKLNVELIWHATGDFGPGFAGMHLSSGHPMGSFVPRFLCDFEQGVGAEACDVGFDSLKPGDKVSARMFYATDTGRYRVGIDQPFPDDAFELLEGVDARYDPIRGCYRIRTDTPGGFNYHYYENQNDYERARFRITNPTDEPRKVYICHETRENPGAVECGVLLDENGAPLPITVQISKNFAGEYEEPFYNPEDTPFSETIFPLHLAPGETREVTSLHLYQNWGNHPLKQFSSLGAWMDYYHSSTGVTETTCYVPFKFGGLPGVAIADLRPMSQRMWDSQPQHDNVAGHRFLMYRSEGEWHYGEYTGTTFRSTGPNWMDIGMGYLSDDGAIRAELDTFELPQSDELRNFVRLRCEVLEPVRVESLRTEFRLLDITTAIQQLRYTNAAWPGPSGDPATREIRAEDGYAVAGERLAGDFPWATVYGDARGCNSFVVRRFAARIGERELGPAVCVQTHKDGNTNLALTVDGDEALLQPGDVIEAEFYLMPYGDGDDTFETPLADRVPFGGNAPRIVSVTRGKALLDFPTRVRTDASGKAEFVMAGGTDRVPIIAEGLPYYRDPRLYRKDHEGNWALVDHSQVGHDGVQVFVCEDNSFGAVFLVNADGQAHTYRVSPGLASR